MMVFYLSLTARLLTACILGGIIGYERENMHRPAGFRTHILVCVGAALVMVTSEYILKEYGGYANIDPSRLGAQVISGIGFLGAGTIIREGLNVKGLTTAASLWAVSCVGIAAGIGFYEGAVAATAIIYITLLVLKKLEKRFIKKSRFNIIYIQSSDKYGQIGVISTILEKYNIVIRNIEFIKSENENSILLKLIVRIPYELEKARVINDLHCMEGVQKIYEE